VDLTAAEAASRRRDLGKIPKVGAGDDLRAPFRPIPLEYHAFKPGRTSCSMAVNGMDEVGARLLFEVAAGIVGITEAATKLTSQGDYSTSQRRHENRQTAWNQ
jgi:hypothetical protein